MKRAELRSMYMYIKQKAEVRQLYDNGILSEEEYEEQRLELVDSLRQLKYAYSINSANSKLVMVL